MPNTLKLSFLASYRSIKGFQSVTLPDLTVICGPNGSGKTQLLDALALKHIIMERTSGEALSARKFDSSPVLVANEVSHATLLAEQAGARDVYFVLEAIEKLLSENKTTNIYTGGQWRPCDRENILNAFVLAFSQEQLQFNSGSEDLFRGVFSSEPDRNGQVRNRWTAFKRFFPSRVLRKVDVFSADKLKSVLYDFISYQTFMEVDVSRIFYRHFEEQQNNSYRRATGTTHLSDAQFTTKYGNPPWEEVNKLLRKFGFRHQLLPPSKEDDPRATNGYTATIISDAGDSIPVSDLSSGEKVIIALLLSTYAAQQNESKVIQIDIPDVILFDELDAHLHPSMTRMMFEVLQASVIGKLGSAVIMSTHSPSTVALAPPSSIFQLTPGPSHRLEPVDNATASKGLSDGFIQILDGSQIAIVEGKDDPLFYRAIEKALRTNMELIDHPSIHFIPASKQTDSSTGGGATAAADWAAKLRDAQLPNIHALLDNDGHRVDAGAIKVLRGRYAIENFVVDPLSIAVTLITDGRLASVNAALATKFPQVSTIGSGSQGDLQMLVDGICSYIQSYNTTLASTATVNVEYSFGKILALPEWVCKRKGKDLVPIIREAFKRIASSYVITRKDFGDFDLELGYLLKLWSQHPNLFPVELRTTLKLLRA